VERMNGRGEIERKLARLLAVQFGEDESSIRSATRLEDDLGADSLACAELLAMIEDEFEVRIDDSEITLAELVTVGDLVALVGAVQEPGELTVATGG
jgi:acyl carrier protein